MMEFRWLTRKKRVTAEQVASYREKNSCTMADAKRILQNERGPTLQYRLGSACQWVDVPHEVITEAK